MKLNKKTSNNATPKKGLSLTLSKTKKLETVNPETFTFKPDLPKVNVIPASVTQKYEVNGILRKATFGLIGLVGVFAIIAGAGMFYTGMLNKQLEELKTERATLQNETTTLQPFQEYKTAIENKRTLLAGQVATDVNMGALLTDLNNTAQANQVNLTTVTVAQQSDVTGLEKGGCINPNPFEKNKAIIGCVTIQGNSVDPQGSKAFVDSLVNISAPAKFINPFIGSLSTAEGVTNFEASVSFTDALYTHQYDSLKTKLEELFAPPAEVLPSPDSPPVTDVDDGTSPTVEQQPSIPPVGLYNSTTEMLKQQIVSLDDTQLQQINELTTQVDCSTETINTITEQIENLIGNSAGNPENLTTAITTLNNSLLNECVSGE